MFPLCVSNYNCLATVFISSKILRSLRILTSVSSLANRCIILFPVKVVLGTLRFVVVVSQRPQSCTREFNNFFIFIPQMFLKLMLYGGIANHSDFNLGLSTLHRWIWVVRKLSIAACLIVHANSLVDS